jgi:hypothetical protein
MRPFAAAVNITVFLIFSYTAAFGAQRSKPSQGSYAVIAGTVFQESGHALAGAAITVGEKPEDGSVPRRKALKGTSDGRGEFAFRVPSIPVRYTVTIEASGYLAQDKEVVVSGEQRLDLYFQMERAASNKK